MIKRLLLMTVALLSASAAQAAWLEASSKHFVVYSNDKPEKLKAFATKLERFDKAYRATRGMPDPELGEGNRLSVYVVSNIDVVQKLAGGGNGIAGFYIPRASGSVAFVPRKLGDGSRTDLTADAVFFHEYTHHLMLAKVDGALPEWFVEGFAEFYATAKFGDDGSVMFGSPPNYRARGLIAGQPLPIEKMLGGDYGRISDQERDSIYGRGWVLTHMLFFEPSRAGQLGKYIDAISNGTPALAAAHAAFGDLKVLQKDLEAYMFRKRLRSYTVPAAVIPDAPVAVRPLSAGEAAFIDVRMRSTRGVNGKTAAALVPEARRAAAAFAGNPAVQAALAEVEFDARNLAEAEAAADRALRVEPRNTHALIYKGRVRVARAQEARSTDRKTWSEARSWFVAASKVDPENPLPKLLYHSSFGVEGRPATRNAVEALLFAMELAPQDASLRVQVARQQLLDGKLAQAKAAIAPVAYNPHAGKAREQASAVMTKIDAGDAKGALALLDKSAAVIAADE